MHPNTTRPAKRRRTKKPIAEQNQHTANLHVEQGLAEAARAGRIIDRDTAQLIAATCHGGPGSALLELATTGTVDAHAALSEIETLQERGDLHIPASWTLSLLAYLVSGLRQEAVDGAA